MNSKDFRARKSLIATNFTTYSLRLATYNNYKLLFEWVANLCAVLVC